jgi:carboxymethylenebutenolidase
VTLERAGRDFEIEHAGGRTSAYVSVPGTGHGAAVLVLAAPAEGTEFTVDVCDRLAREGFVALGLFEQSDLARATPGLDAALAELVNQHATDGPRVGIVGFAEGALRALLASARSERVGAIVAFHAAPSDDEWEALAPDGLRAPLLAFFGGKEESIASGAADALVARVDEGGGRARMIALATAGAGFMNAARPDGYDASAAAESWDLLLAFLRSEL